MKISLPAPPESESLPVPPKIVLARLLPVMLAAFVREEASITVIAEPTVTGDFEELVTVKPVGCVFMTSIFGLSKSAAP